MKKMLLAMSAAVLLAACTPITQQSVNNAGDQVKEAAQQAGDAMQQAADQVAMSKMIPLSEQNDLGQSGTAVLTETKEGKLNVKLSMSGGKFTLPQPAHIHVGSCPNPGAVKYPLNNVVNGMSETVLDVKLDDVMKSADKLAINVHKSAAESKVYTACGDIK
jgi:hypothetical protein